MNENYLWDKTGSDAEIEELEEMLSVFRHEPGELPLASAPSNVLTFPQRSSKRHYIYAIAASLAVAALAGTWFLRQGPSNDLSAAGPSVQQQIDQPRELAVKDELSPKTDERPVQRTEERSLAITEKPVVTKASYKIRRVEPSTRVRTAKPQLTKEEQYAYGQLLLALSITSSKLNVVRDTINKPEGVPGRADK